MKPPPAARRGTGLRTLAAVAAGAATAVTAVRLYRSWIERLDEESGHTCAPTDPSGRSLAARPAVLLPRGEWMLVGASDGHPALCSHAAITSQVCRVGGERHEDAAARGRGKQ